MSHKGVVLTMPLLSLRWAALLRVRVRLLIRASSAPPLDGTDHETTCTVKMALYLGL